MTESRRPFLIRMLVLLYAFVAIVTGVMILVTLLSSDGAYRINGDAVTRAEFLVRAVPWLLLVGIAAGSLAWAFRTERAWARHAFVIMWTAAIVNADVRFWNDPAIDADEVFVTIFSVVCLLPVLWYFYLKRNVVAYYRSLARRSAPHAS
jgi:hypothetical protein